MATSKDTSPMGKPRGRIGDLVYKWYGKKLVVTRVPQFTKPWSPGQKRWRAQVSRASAYAEGARQDPEFKKYYEWLAKKLQIPFRAAAIKDYLTRLEIRYADLSRYIGGIRASFNGHRKVCAVHLVVRRADGAVLEEGPMAVDLDGGVFVPTKPPPSGELLTLEVTGRDRPGHTVTAKFVGQPDVRGSLRPVEPPIHGGRLAEKSPQKRAKARR